MNPLHLTNVPDPTDFPSSQISPGLRDLDASLRCNICGEVYDAPVTLNCGHSFCSYCIRSSLAVKQECPTCRKTAIEGHIRPNPVVEDIVANWKLSRPYILGLIEWKLQERERNSPPLTPRPKKRKLMPETVSSRASSSTSVKNQQSPSKPKKVKAASSHLFTTIPTSDAEEDELVDPSYAQKEPKHDDLVDCPLCNKRVKFNGINEHMDKGCKDTPPISISNKSSASDWKKLMAKPSDTKGKQKDVVADDDEYPLPKASYNTLKDKKLKDMLVEYGLPTSGDRPQWIQRHQRWVIMYNANLDKAPHHRRSKDDLMKGLKKWEEEKAKRKKITVQDTVAHEKQHRDEFARLVEAAKRKPHANVTEGTSIAIASNKGMASTHSSSDVSATKQAGQATCTDIEIVLDSEEEEL